MKLDASNVVTTTGYYYIDMTLFILNKCYNFFFFTIFCKHFAENVVLVYSYKDVAVTMYDLNDTKIVDDISTNRDVLWKISVLLEK